MSKELAISKQEYQARLQKTRSLMMDKNLDGLLIFSSFQEREGHVSYLCGHHNVFPNAMTHLGMGLSALIVPAEGETVLAAPLGSDLAGLVNVGRVAINQNLTGEIIKTLKSLGKRDAKWGIAGMDILPTDIYLKLSKGLPAFEWSNTDSILESQRLIKSAAEIELLRKAAQVADVGLQAGLHAAQPGASQQDVELAVREACLKAGADFIPRVRVSSGASIQTLNWPFSTQAAIQEGDFLFLEVTGWVRGYGFDASRVIFIGQANTEQQDYLNHLAEATQWMIDCLKPDKKFTFYYTESRERFIYPALHGIGLEISETPWLQLNQAINYHPGMILCVAPTVVDPQFGSLYIKQMVLITKQGHEILTKTPIL